ncbi:citryl-CoA lyase [Devosia sp. A449]
MAGVKTHIATSDASSVTIRGKSLAGELIGQRSFTEMLYFLVCHTVPDAGQTKVLDACLVTLMEHGWTPTSMIARLTADSVPEEPQVAIAAGLLSVGSVFAGTMDGCAKILAAGKEAQDARTYFEAVVQEHRQSGHAIPGFGHRLHKPDDPRTGALLEVGKQSGVPSTHCDLLAELGAAVDANYGKHITINATGAIGALLLDIGVPISAMRSVAVVSRAGGLAGHLIEEQQNKAAREMWRLTRENIPYEGKD